MKAHGHTSKKWQKAIQSFSALHWPAKDNKTVKNLAEKKLIKIKQHSTREPSIVLSSKRDEILVRRRERQCLHVVTMKCQFAVHVAQMKIPHYDVGL